jgi:hypothetical protein
VAHGKYWGVSWDLSKCGHALPELPEPGTVDGDAAPVQEVTGSGSAGKSMRTAAGQFRARYDHAFVKGAQIHAVRDPGADVDGGQLLPNAKYPSDHLPIALVLRVPRS